MKNFNRLLFVTALIGFSLASIRAQEADAGLKGSKDITKALTQTILIPKGTSAKSARVRAREVRSINLQAIRFKFDSTELADIASYQQVAELAKSLKDPALSDCVITLEGHTDDLGTETYNLDLSQRRAEAVKGILTSRYGVPSSRLQTIGKGKSAPLVNDTTEAARAENRRVSVIREP